MKGDGGREGGKEKNVEERKSLGATEKRDGERERKGRREGIQWRGRKGGKEGERTTGERMNIRKGPREG